MTEQELEDKFIAKLEEIEDDAKAAATLRSTLIRDAEEDYYYIMRKLARERMRVLMQHTVEAMKVK